MADKRLLPLLSSSPKVTSGLGHINVVVWGIKFNLVRNCLRILYLQHFDVNLIRAPVHPRTVPHAVAVLVHRTVRWTVARGHGGLEESVLAVLGVLVRPDVAEVWVRVVLGW